MERRGGWKATGADDSGDVVLTRTITETVTVNRSTAQEAAVYLETIRMVVLSMTGVLARRTGIVIHRVEGEWTRSDGGSS